MGKVCLLYHEKGIIMELFEFLGEIRTTDRQIQAIQKSIKELRKTDVLIGIPQEETDREEGSVTNAELLYIHTNGSPANNIPPRPVIEPAIQDSKEEIGTLLKEAILKALEGDTGGAMSGMEKAGLQGENAAKGWFTNPKNNWARNAESTIKQKGSSKPLIDTGQLRKSITHIVKKKG